MNQDSLNKMRALTESRRKLVEDSVNSKETATNLLKESGYLDENGVVVNKYQAGLKYEYTDNPFFRISNPRSQFVTPGRIGNKNVQFVSPLKIRTFSNTHFENDQYKGNELGKIMTVSKSPVVVRIAYIGHRRSNPKKK